MSKVESKYRGGRRIRSALYTLTILFPLALFALPVWAQASVPFNAQFTNGSLNGWAGSGCAYSSNGGYNGARAFYGSDGCWMQSRPFIPTAESAVTFWHRRDNVCCGALRVWLHDYTDGGHRVVALESNNLDTHWRAAFFSIADFAGKVVALEFNTFAPHVYVSHIGVSAATNAPLPANGRYLNGQFSGSMASWTTWGFYLGYGYDATVGYGAAGSVKRNATWWSSVVASLPFVNDGAGWSWWMKGNANTVYSFTLDDFTTYGQNQTYVTGTANASDWVNVSLASTTGMQNRLVRIRLDVYQNGGGESVWLDDICPATGCLGNYTDWLATWPTPTTAGGGGGGTYPTLDWSQFPTAVPFPTFPPYPTQIPLPTPLYGFGTPQPITGSVTISGTVKIDDSTPVAVKVDDRTPVRVSIGPDPNYTPQVPANWGGSVSSSAPNPGMGIPTLISSPSQSTIQYGQAGPSTNPINFHIAGSVPVTGEHTI